MVFEQSSTLDRGLLQTRKLPNHEFLVVKLKSSLRKFYGHHHGLVNHYGISLSQMTTYIFPLFAITIRSFTHWRFFIGFITRVAMYMLLVIQELLILQKHMSSHPVFGMDCVSQALVFCVAFCRSLVWGGVGGGAIVLHVVPYTTNSSLVISLKLFFQIESVIHTKLSNFFLIYTYHICKIV